MSVEQPNERIVYGACQHDCPDNCAMEVLVRDGTVVSVKGRHDHPFTHGVLCAKVKTFEKRVYAPDRILHPMRRTGPKGTGQFERISWDDALDEIRDRFRTVIDTDGAEAILPYSYLGSQGLLNGMNCGDPFFNRLGATIAERTFCNSGASKAYRMVCGTSGGLDPESFVHAKLIILWGINIISTAMHHWRFVKDAMKQGAKLVVIDPLRSRTAARADWHIRPKPGTDVVLALGLINQIIADGAHDADYVAQYTEGFDALKERAAAYTPERTSEITGVPADEIVQLARDYASTHPTAIRSGVAMERTRNGPDAVRAIAALPALTGAWRHVGGGYFQHPQSTFPIRRDRLTCPETVEDGRRVINLFGLADALRADAEKPIKALFVYNANPVTAVANQNAVIEGLKRDDLFTVVSEIFPTDATDYADIILPAASQLEQLDLMYSWGHVNLQLNKPAIEPLGEAVSNTELFRRLAAHMEFEDADLHRTDEEIVNDSLDWNADQLSGITLDTLRRDGFARLNIGDKDARMPHAEGNFPTPSGKCEFASSVAEQGGVMIEVYRQGYLGSEPGGAVDPIPEFKAQNADTTHPFVLVSPKSHTFLNSGYTNFPSNKRVAYDQPLWLHPQDAEALGIDTGDRVSVFNEQGDVAATAKVTDDTLPGVVVIPHGHWRKHVGGATVNALVKHAPADIGRAPTINDAQVGVRKA